MGSKVKIIVKDDEEKDDSNSFGKVLLRLIIWGLIILIFIAALMTGFAGESIWASILEQTPPTQDMGGGMAGQPQTESGMSEPTSTVAPASDENPSQQPIPAVILQPTAWVYPAPPQPAPTQPALPSPTTSVMEGACPYFDGAVILVELNSSGFSPTCFSIAAWQRLSITNRLDATVQLSIRDHSMQLGAGQSGEFSEPLGSLLIPGANDLIADQYGVAQIWLVVR
jgi:hypothetical protein